MSENTNTNPAPRYVRYAVGWTSGVAHQRIETPSLSAAAGKFRQLVYRETGILAVSLVGYTDLTGGGETIANWDTRSGVMLSPSLPVGHPARDAIANAGKNEPQE